MDINAFPPIVYPRLNIIINDILLLRLSMLISFIFFIKSRYSYGIITNVIINQLCYN